MAIYSLDELRNTAPPDMRQMPDELLLCKYAERKGLDVNEVAVRLKLEQLTPIYCDRELAIESVKTYHLPLGGLSAGLFVGLSFSIILFVGKHFFKKIKRKTFISDLIRSAIVSCGFGLMLGVVSMINHPVYISLLIAILWGAVIGLFGILCSSVVALRRSKKIITDLKFLVFQSIPRIRGRKDPKIWHQIAEEIRDGKINSGMWFQALSQSNGDEQKAKSLYMRLRYDELKASSF